MEISAPQLRIVKARAEEMARLLGALANARRLLILCRLFKQGEASAGQLSNELEIGPSALSQHLARMLDQGLISQRRDVRHLIYRIADTTFTQLPSLLQTICSGSGSADETDDTAGETMADDPTAGVTPPSGGAGAMAGDAFWVTPAIDGAGKIHPLPDAAHQPDASGRYKIVFALGRSKDPPDQPHSGLERVARTINLYVNAGVPLAHLHLTAVVSGASTALALDEEHYRHQFGVANPNLPLIAQLRGTGVEIAVCGQAVAEHHFDYAWIDARVTLALSALTTIAELQQTGHALIPL